MTGPIRLDLAPGRHAADREGPLLALRKTGFADDDDAVRWVDSLTPLGARRPRGLALRCRIRQARPALAHDAVAHLQRLAEGAEAAED